MESYYKTSDLPRFGEISEEAPELAARFFEYYESVFKEGELTEREKSLIALAVAHSDPLPLLHRRLHADMPGKGFQPCRNDGSRSTWRRQYAVAPPSCMESRCGM